MGFFYETTYVSLEAKFDNDGSEATAREREQRATRRWEYRVIDNALEQEENLIIYSRLCSVSASEFCTVDLDTLMHSWTYKDFVPIENYVLFQEDRKAMAQKWEDQKNKSKSGGH